MKNGPIRLFLLRHGNTFEKHETPVQVGARSDLPLTQQGREQARHFCSYLLGNQIIPRAIYAGGLKRQAETASILTAQMNAENSFHNEHALTELDYGHWEGLTSEAIAEKWPNEYVSWTSQAEWPRHIFGGSQDAHVGEMMRWINELRNCFNAGDAVIGVTSNGIIRFFYSLLADEWQRCIQQKQMEKLKVKTGHYCELLLYPNHVEIKSWNSNPLSQ